MEDYCPDDEVEKLESEFWNHKMVGSDIDGYTARFHELARLVPHMVTPESQRVNRYIRGLAPEIKAHVTSSQPATIQDAVSMANRLTTDGIKDGIFKKKENAGNKKRSNDQNMNRGRDDRNKRQRTRSNFALTTLHQGQGKRQYAGGNCPNPMLAIEGNPKPGNNRNRAQGRAFALGVAEAPQDPNIMTGTFSLNDHFAIVLFDSGADYSFISTNFLPLIDMKPSVINPGYEIKIASGVKVVTNMIVRGCILELEGHTFIINLIPFGHGSFDVIIRMDWLSKLRAKIPEIPKWKWENITMDFINKLPRTRSGHDSIWVIVDRLTKSAHFLAVRKDYKTEKLARLYINEIIARHVAYRLRLPQELVGVHDTFQVSNLKKYLADVNLHVPLDEVKVDDKLHFVEEPIGILDRGVKKLKRRWIPIVKVRWNSRRGPEFTWEWEDEMKRKYPHLFASATVERATKISGRNSL
uniref:Reverse transcriptase domain-containing protein n=1 Tax=Tanacetum cinerariifolium TaxID=118510 RepID=A0A6L2LPW5_TANCI|nr:hypothetical protein [Tanacetum cinerariifolium]